MTKLHFLVFTALLVALAFFPKSASAQLDPVHISLPDNTFGNGGRFRLNKACATITAAHVVASTSFPTLSPNGSPDDEAKVVVADEPMDIAIIHQRHEDPSLCAEIPETGKIVRAIRTNVRGRLWVSDKSGSTYALDIELKRRDNETLEVTLLPGQSETAFQPGFSGAMVVFNDVPVAIITDALLTSSATAKATRLDRIAQRFPSLLGLAGPEASIAASPEEQLKSLDPDIQFAAVTLALGGSDKRMRRKAISAGLKSNHNIVRSATVAHLVCAKKGIVINSELPAQTFKNPGATNLSWAYGSTRLKITACDKETGTFSVSIRSRPGQWNRTKIFESPEAGQASGTGISISFVTGVFEVPGQCTVNLELRANARLEGLMTCQQSIYNATTKAWMDLI